MANEIVLDSYSDAKFIEGITKLNQENWMAYFGSICPSGVIDGCYVDYRWNRLRPGAIIANGILAKIPDTEAFTIPNYHTDGYYDTFVFARIFLQEGVVEIIAKQISDSFDLATICTIEKNFIGSESYQCVRNEEIYDIPLLYRSSIFSEQYWTVYNNDVFDSENVGVDLRRYGDKRYAPGYNAGQFKRLSKSQNSYIGTGKYAIDRMNPPEFCTIYYTGNDYSQQEIMISKQRWGNGIHKLNSNDINFSVPSGWESSETSMVSDSHVELMPVWKKTIPSYTKYGFHLIKTGDYSDYLSYAIIEF